MKKLLSLLVAVAVIQSFQSCDSDEDIKRAEVTTREITDITHQRASGGGEVVSDGGSEVTVRGICWGIQHDPTIESDGTTDGTGPGVFTSELTGLTGETTYFVRAYAINKAGIAYGNEVQFTTAPTPVLATLSTTVISDITTNSATSGGSIADDGNADITARGVCWSLNANPTIDDFKTSDGTGTGAFSSQLTSLEPGKTYHVRAYATNVAGTAYGNDISFSTNSIVTTLYAVKDATIFNNQAGNAANGNYGAGGSELLQVGYASPTGIYARTLLQFDLSSIPSDAVIESVSLELTLGSSGTFVPQIDVYKVSQSWTEGNTSFCTYNNSCNTQGISISPGGTDVTWNETTYSGSNTNPWSAAGGAFNSTVSATSVDAGASTILYTSAGLEDDVQSWVSGASSNFGWILKTDFITNTSAMRRFRSREGATASGSANTAPRLTIVYH